MSSRENVRHFHFLREIGSGGFGSVFLARVIHSDGFSRLVAVKLLKNQWTDSEEIASRMRDEARLLGLLRHRNIVDVLDLTSIDGRVAVIMEYLEGVDLRQISRRLMAKDESFSVRGVLEMGSAVASALDAAYNRPPFAGEKPLRVIHRDIKPNNIMLDDMGMTKVLDFGVARSELDSRESHTQELQFGSVEYMAPERLFFEPETPASDVYSLGATLFELMALEKFGKARGRPERHGAFVEDRLRALSGMVKIEGMVETEMMSLFRSCLLFEHEGRPSASDVAQRCRALARLIDDEDLQSWSERMMPDMIQLALERPREKNPLLDSTVTEDSVLVRLSRSVEQVEDRVQSTDNSEALRRGALADLARSGDLDPNPASGSPVKMAEEPDPPSAWDDGPTNVESMDALTDRSPLDVPTIPPLDEMVEHTNEATEVVNRFPLELSDSIPLVLTSDEATTESVYREKAQASADTPTEVVDATRLLELAAELKFEDQREGSLTDEATQGLEDTRPSMGEDLTLSSGGTLPPVFRKKVRPPVPVPPSTPPVVESRELEEDGAEEIQLDEPEMDQRIESTPSFAVWLKRGFLLLGLAMLILIGVMFMFRERLSDQICQRGVELPGFSCSQKDRKADRERDDDQEESAEAPEEEEAEEPSVVGPSDPSEVSGGIVFSFPDHEEQGVETIKLSCGGDSVSGTWWVHVDETEMDDCSLRTFPSRERIKIPEPREGRYSCNAAPEISCEREE